MILEKIVAMLQLLEMKIFAQFKILVDKIKVIVILMMNVRIVLCVDQTIVQNHSILLLISYH